MRSVQKVPGTEANAPRSSDKLLFLQTTSHTSLTTTGCKKPFTGFLQIRENLQSIVFS